MHLSWSTSSSDVLPEFLRSSPKEFKGINGQAFASAKIRDGWQSRNGGSRQSKIYLRVNSSGKDSSQLSGNELLKIKNAF